MATDSLFVRREARLSNGLRVLLVPRPSLHRVSIAAYVRVGSRFETAEDNGISHFLEHMLYRGTPSFATSHEQALAFERLGGMLYAATATDHGLMTLSLPPETLLQAIPHLGEVAQHPRFTGIEIERRIVHEEILEDLDDDGRQIDADNLTREVLFGDHPLGFPITGTPDHLARFDEAALRKHHQRHYGTSNMVLTVAGAFDDDAVLASLEKSLGTLGVGTPVVTLAPPKAEGKARIRYVESDGSQTDLRIAFRAPGDHDPEERATEVLLRVIDDGMSTRLYERLCDEQGLCYDVSAAYEAFEDDGIFDVSAESQHARVADVTREVLSLCLDLVEHGPSDAELDKVRSRAIWGTRAMLDDADELAGFYGLSTLANVTASPDTRCDEICAVTKEDVRRVAERIFRPEGLGVIAVGVLSKTERKRLDAVVRAFRG